MVLCSVIAAVFTAGLGVLIAGVGNVYTGVRSDRNLIVPPPDAVTCLQTTEASSLERRQKVVLFPPCPAGFDSRVVGSKAAYCCMPDRPNGHACTLSPGCLHTRTQTFEDLSALRRFLRLLCW